MEQSLTLFTWFTGVLILVIVVIDILLALKFRRYFRANGFGIVTITLLSFVIAQALAALIFGITSATILTTAGKSKSLFYTMKDLGTLWIMATTLLHIMGITFQRVFSFSYGNTFLQFTRSKTNIGLLILIIWACSILITLLCLTSGTAVTYSVFYVGLFISGVLTILNFIITLETSLFKQKALERHEDSEIVCPTNFSVHTSKPKRVRVVQNPRKTFSLFSGLVFSFILFCLPATIPNLIFNLRGKLLTQSTSLIISLWLLLGVVFNSMWILIRLRSTVNDTSGFYARWTLGKSRENLALFFGRKKKGEHLINENNLDDSTGHATEQEHI